VSQNWSGDSSYWSGGAYDEAWAPSNVGYTDQLRRHFDGGTSAVVQAGEYFVNHTGGTGYTQSWDNGGIVTPNTARADVLIVNQANIQLNLNLAPLVIGQPDWARSGTSSATTTSLDVGTSGTGSLVIANARRNDSVPASSSYYIYESTQLAGVGIGQFAGSTGRLTFQNSDALIDGRLVVGNAGHGHLQVVDGSTVYVTDDSTIAEQIGSTSTVLVKGRSSASIPGAPAGFAREGGYPFDYWPAGYLGTDFYSFVDANSAPIAAQSVLRYQKNVTLGGTQQSSGGQATVTIDDAGRVEIKDATILIGSSVTIKKNGELRGLAEGTLKLTGGAVTIEEEGKVKLDGRLEVSNNSQIKVHIGATLAHSSGQAAQFVPIAVKEQAQVARGSILATRDEDFRPADSTYYHVASAEQVVGHADHAGRTIDLDGQALSVQYGRDAAGIHLKPLAKYKQFSSPWADSFISDKKMSQVGCTITSLAVVAGMFGNDVTPTQMLSHVKSNNLTSGNSTHVNSWTYNATGPDSKPVRISVQADRSGNWSTLVNALWDGSPVMVGVPSHSTIGLGGDSNQRLRSSNDNVHYLVAYGINPALKPGDTVRPSDVYIIDPGWGTSSYSGVISGYAMDSDGDFRVEETFNMTMDNFFQQLNNYSAAQPNHPTKRLRHDPLEWFNNKRFFSTLNAPDGRPYEFTLPDYRQNQMITRFTSDQQNIVPSIAVNSPVELVLTDPLTGQRYVSSPEFLLEGDILLTKSAFDDPAPVDEDTDPTLDPFRHYVLNLPVGLLGVDLDVTVLGVGDGNYNIRYLTGSPLFDVSDALSGSIFTGQTFTGSFNVSVVPEPATATITLAAMLVVCARRPRTPRRFVTVPH